MQRWTLEYNSETGCLNILDINALSEENNFQYYIKNLKVFLTVTAATEVEALRIADSHLDNMMI